jgi:hypothetical protein
MSFDVSPPARVFAASPVGRPTPAAGRTSESSFRVQTPDASTPPIPSEVWDQVDAAARLAEDLHSQGRSIRFDVHKLDGGVVANLVDGTGLLRPMLLSDVVDVDRLGQELDKDPS